MDLDFGAQILNINPVRVTEYCAKALALDRNKKDPFLDFLGFNFCEDKLVQVKFYFTFYDVQRFFDRQFLLPVWHDFEQHLPMWLSHGPNSGFNSGISYALKLNLAQELEYQFHFLLPKTEISKASVKVAGQDFVCQGKGIAYAYQKQEFKFKDYSYFGDPRLNQSILNLFELPTAIVSLIEHSKFLESEKIVLWLDPQRTDLYLQSVHDPVLIECSKWMASEFGATAFHPGFYKGLKKKSLYFRLGSQFRTQRDLRLAEIFLDKFAG